MARSWKTLTAIAVLVAVLVVAWRIQQFQRDPHLRFQRGMEAARNGDTETAFRDARFLLKVPEFKSHGHMLRGTLFLAIRRYAAAAVAFRLAAEDPKMKVEAYTRCGEALYRMQRFVDAEGVLLQALELDESYSDARRWLASTYYDLGAMTNALEHLKIIGLNNPNDGRPYRLRGLIQKDFELYDQAIPEYETALKRELPDSERDAVLLELADCLVHQLRYDDALKTLKSADPSAKSRSLEAQCYAALGRSDEAEFLADAAIRMDPDNVASILTKASIAIENGRAADVLPVLKAAAARHSADHDILFQLIKALRSTGHAAEADALAPRLAELNRLMDEFAALHLEAFNDVSNADLRFQIGQIALRLDRPKLARSWLQAALAIDADHPAARKLLAEIPSEESR